MRKIWTIAAKDLIATYTDRNLLIIMLLTPLLLSTIIALAFGGGASGDSAGPSLSDIPIAIVNQDQGINPAGEMGSLLPPGTDLRGTLFDLSLTSESAITGTDTTTATSSGFNIGDVLVSILAPDSPQAAASTTSFSSDNLPACPLVAEGSNSGYDTTLDQLFNTTVLTDTTAARAGVEGGEYAAAILIPPDFSNRIMPFGQFGAADGAVAEIAPVQVAPVEVYANAGMPIEASVARAVTEGIVGQFSRMGLAVQGLGDSVIESMGPMDSEALAEPSPALTAPAGEWQAFLARQGENNAWFAALAGLVGGLSGGNDSAVTDENMDENIGDEVGGALACLFAPGAGSITIMREPVNKLQEQPRFARVMVQVGSAQAVFFALFTGVFGVLSIYDERKQWTLQRMLASPTSRTTVLTGFLTGNVVVVLAQLALLMLFLTGISSLILRRPIFIWGGPWYLLLLLMAAISICVAGLGVLVVGLARREEQVQVFGPMVNMFLGALGGSFGFYVPAALANLSLITWATDAFRTLATGETDIWLNLTVLAVQGALFFGVGVWLFRKRLDL
ncbi:MAG: ABC transporter permease [Caldilineaceae bacterium]|nr:ABC transporter permease [Caldilineaceae bacterium]